MDILSKIAVRIIREQEVIIGPIALQEAKKVKGMKIDTSSWQIFFSGDKKNVVNDLVRQYSRLFGRASEEVCRDAVRDLISDLPKQDIPSSLR